jgi:Uma2 family endonuclease
VDNELQDLIPGLLKALLAVVWVDRWDWFFGVDMGIYFDPDQPPIVPDGFEYSSKKQEYADLGFQYYAVYSPLRKQKAHLEVYELAGDRYELKGVNQVWLDQIGLALGSERGSYLGIEREWLYWYDAEGSRIPLPEEQVEQERQQAELERQRADRLAQRLRELGIDPDQDSDPKTS